MQEQKEKRAKPKKGTLFRVYKKFVLYVLLVGILQTIQQSVLFFVMQKLFGRVPPLLFNLINAAFILLLVGFIGYRYYRHVKRVGEGIKSLAKGESVYIPEEGVAEELARSVNQTSVILEEQQKMIAQRDTARIDWIRGISHDIRTPLSMVMGYSEMLEEEEGLTAEQRQCVTIIKEQSIKMKELIEDLNLTSKLEYNKQPLRLSEFRPAELLREAVANAINAQFDPYGRTDSGGTDGKTSKNEEGGDFMEKYNIDLLILPEFERLLIKADHNLLRRVFDNLIGNAIRHNPNGCSIAIMAYKAGEHAIVEIRDSGAGIPESVARTINALGSEFAAAEEAETENAELPDRPHIMGMRIAKQIMLTHGGNLIVKPDRHTVKVILGSVE